MSDFCLPVVVVVVVVVVVCFGGSETHADEYYASLFNKKW